MRQLFIICLIALFTLQLWASEDTKSIEVKINKIAPDFKLLNHAGATIEISKYRGKHVVLEWWNYGCPFVKKHYKSQNMTSLQKRFTKQGVVWLSIVSSAPDKQGFVTKENALKEMTKRGGKPSSILLDPTGKVGRKYGAKTTPHMFVINPKGIVVYMGAIDSVASADASDIKGATNYVVAALESSLAGKTPKIQTSVPYGCSVKYN